MEVKVTIRSENQLICRVYVNAHEQTDHFRARRQGHMRREEGKSEDAREAQEGMRMRGVGRKRTRGGEGAQDESLINVKRSYLQRPMRSDSEKEQSQKG